MQDILSDLEKEAIAAFLANETMKEAVRKVLLAPVYQNGVLEAGKPAQPLKNFALTLINDIENQGLGGAIDDAALGRDLRAAGKAVRMIELGFTQLEKCVPAPAAPAPATKPAKGK